MNRFQEARRREAMKKKYEEIEGLRSLVATWEPKECDNHDTLLYVRNLRRKLKHKQTELSNMGGDT